MTGSPPASPAPAGVYLHFPFCASRCSYCDFPTVAGRGSDIGRYLRALEREIEASRQMPGGEVDSVYIGGGSPSLMSAEQLHALLAAIGRRFEMASGAEVTIECNPDHLDREKLLAFGQAGVTRITIGLQSLDDAVLRRAGRTHGGRRGLEAVRLARGLEGMETNADLILGLPGERLERWVGCVERTAALGTDHLSVYMLETDKDSPLARAIRSGRAVIEDAERIAEVYLQTVATLGGLGLAQYEISNFARAGRRSRHNMKYWTDVWYAGLGAGAHGYMEGGRRSNESDLDAYIAAAESERDPLAAIDPWNPRRRLEEAVIMGLRLTAGLDLASLGERYEVDLMRLYAEEWDRACEHGLLRIEGSRARLTAAGMLHGNELFGRLVLEE